MDQTLLKIALTRQAVIFDFDGVLAKIQVDWAALKKELREFITTETGTCAELTPFDPQLNAILKAAPVELSEKVNQIIAAYELKTFDQHLIFLEVLKTAENLANNGVPLFICSSNTREVIERILRQTDTFTCFRQIVSREDVRQRKPDPEGLLKILADHRLNPKKTLFVGDRKIDQQAGTAAGIETLLVKPQHSGS